MDEKAQGYIPSRYKIIIYFFYLKLNQYIINNQYTKFVPGTTDIREPRVQKNTRGRPSLKKTQQKRRADPVRQESCRFSCSTVPNFVGLDSIKEPARHSSYEFDLNKEPMIDLNEVSDDYESSQVIDLNKMPTMKGSSILDDIPNIFHPYITNIHNVEGDGNCGYRALAVCLGLDEHDYFEYIRQQMGEELRNRYDLYEEMFRNDIHSLTRTLCFVGRPCPPEYWMKMPAAGVLIANKFGVIVHYLNMLGSSTIFPFWRGPEEIQPHRAITIALVNNHSHYVMVQLEGDYPMPGIIPYWHPCRISQSATRWEPMYRSRLDLFTRLCRRVSGFVDVSD